MPSGRLEARPAPPDRRGPRAISAPGPWVDPGAPGGAANGGQTSQPKGARRSADTSRGDVFHRFRPATRARGGSERPPSGPPAHPPVERRRRGRPRRRCRAVDGRRRGLARLRRRPSPGYVRRQRLRRVGGRGHVPAPGPRLRVHPAGGRAGRAQPDQSSAGRPVRVDGHRAAATRWHRVRLRPARPAVAVACLRRRGRSRSAHRRARDGSLHRLPRRAPPAVLPPAPGHRHRRGSEGDTRHVRLLQPDHPAGQQRVPDPQAARRGHHQWAHDGAGHGQDRQEAASPTSSSCSRRCTSSVATPASVSGRQAGLRGVDRRHVQRQRTARQRRRRRPRAVAECAVPGAGSGLRPSRRPVTRPPARCSPRRHASRRTDRGSCAWWVRAHPGDVPGHRGRYPRGVREPPAVLVALAVDALSDHGLAPGGPAHRPARAPGPARPAHGPAQPRADRRPGRTDAPSGTPAAAARRCPVHRPGQLQGDQRHLRARRGRSAPAGGGPAPVRDAARQRQCGPTGR